MVETREAMTTQWLAGVDGCRDGWIVAFVAPAGPEARVRVVPGFADILAAPEQPIVIAVDMPIGLPERIGANGRGPERAVRPLLGQRQSSVFAVPSRRAVYAADFADVCRLAVETSEPPRKVSRQLFALAPKIKEIDTQLRAAPALTARVYEVHPEVAFWRLNGETALTEPKKIKGTPYGPGLAERRRLRVGEGFSGGVVEAVAPKGAAADDLLDALACAAVARRIHEGRAMPFPDPPLADAYGLPMAIWA
jgi:predicted RNase H-like nuclease